MWPCGLHLGHFHVTCPGHERVWTKHIPASFSSVLDFDTTSMCMLTLHAWKGTCRQPGVPSGRPMRYHCQGVWSWQLAPATASPKMLSTTVCYSDAWGTASWQATQCRTRAEHVCGRRFGQVVVRVAQQHWLVDISQVCRLQKMSICIGHARCMLPLAAIRLISVNCYQEWVMLTEKVGPGLEYYNTVGCCLQLGLNADHYHSPNCLTSDGSQGRV
jgi:hypothetical protein